MCNFFFLLNVILPADLRVVGTRSVGNQGLIHSPLRQEGGPLGSAQSPFVLPMTSQAGLGQSLSVEFFSRVIWGI